jgi:hypothetical protein
MTDKKRILVEYQEALLAAVPKFRSVQAQLSTADLGPSLSLYLVSLHMLRSHDLLCAALYSKYFPLLLSVVSIQYCV